MPNRAQGKIHADSAEYIHRTGTRSNSRKKRKAGQKKAPGRKKGHEGSQREAPDKIDEEAERTKDECNGALTPTGNTEEVVIENVIPARVELGGTF